MSRATAVQHMVQWRIMALSVSAWILASILVNALVFPGLIGAKLGQIHMATGGMVEPTLVCGLLVLFVFMSVVVAVAHVPPAAIGWVRSAIVPGLITTVGFWLLMQGALVVLTYLGGQTVALHPSWQAAGPGFVIGGVLGQVFGNALAEETAFRGFFFSQLRLRSRVFGSSGSVAFAAVSSALLFAVTHIPNRLWIKNVPLVDQITDQFQLFIAGLLFALVFVATRNLFATVGLHALANDPAPVVAAPAYVVKGTYQALLCALLVYSLIRVVVTRRSRTYAQPGDAVDTALAGR